MRSEREHSLLVGLEFQNAPVMTGWLRRRRYESLIVSTFREACESIQTGQYRVILSKSQLPDGSGFRLIEHLAGLPVTLFISFPVEDSCIWLPAIVRGVYCWGAGALRPEAFVQLLEAIITANAREYTRESVSNEASLAALAASDK